MSALPDRPTPVSQGGILICGFIAIFLYGISVLQSSGASSTFLRKDVHVFSKLPEGYSVDQVTEQLQQYSQDFIISYTDLSVLDSGSWTIYVGAIMSNDLSFDEGQNTKTNQKAGSCGLHLGSICSYGNQTNLIILAAAFGLCWVVKDSVKLIRTIMIYAMNRLVLTMIVGLAQTIMIIVNVNNMSGYSIDYISVHLYVNSFLAALNARNNTRGNSVVSYATSWEANPGPGPTRSARMNLSGLSSSMDDSIPPNPSVILSPTRSVQTFGQLLQKGDSTVVETDSYPLSDMDCKSNSQAHAV
ncbi:hypothetical protein K435DRAFT_803158 [Dendrothele bispora CBS 962.96]|uniref:DUF6534 domain-containing protein n=1 Tax=Dendrothele bispora (strain CBS 962.96) TaxID=1314807 RepID=A0A4S8LIA8_DENBC|nr:hypothetical protein K435DRAFT_803158 [Dendrothele bispora CBS 962.96]